MHSFPGISTVDQKQINEVSMLAGIVGQIGCLTVLIIAVAFGAGTLLDRLLDTKPIFTLLAVVGSVPVTLYLTVRVALTTAARAQKVFSKSKTEDETTQ